MGAYHFSNSDIFYRSWGVPGPGGAENTPAPTPLGRAKDAIGRETGTKPNNLNNTI